LVLALGPVDRHPEGDNQAGHVLDALHAGSMVASNLLVDGDIAVAANVEELQAVESPVGWWC
jgi:hypothetical protein